MRWFAVATLLLFAPPVPAGTLVQFRTVLGDIDVELFEREKPVTAQNFIRYVRSNLYQNVFLHRCIPGFIVQGGGFTTANPQSPYAFAQYYTVPAFAPIANEFNVGPRLSNTYGTLAMAKVSGNPNSATSQWFLNLANNSTCLDTQSGGFTVFGKVLRGTNVLQFFNSCSLNYGIIDLQNCYPGSPNAAIFSDLPVYYYGGGCPRYVDLYYVDISLLNVLVTLRTNGARKISWNSVNGLTNRVEFTTNFPPNWQLLVSTNGLGGVTEVIDSSIGNTSRFYRVRVVY